MHRWCHEAHTSQQSPAAAASATAAAADSVAADAVAVVIWLLVLVLTVAAAAAWHQAAATTATTAASLMFLHCQVSRRHVLRFQRLIGFPSSSAYFTYTSLILTFVNLPSGFVLWNKRLIVSFKHFVILSSYCNDAATTGLIWWIKVFCKFCRFKPMSTVKRRLRYQHWIITAIICLWI